MSISSLKKKIFSINTDERFNETALEIFRRQWQNNHVYRDYCDRLRVRPQTIDTFQEIPFLPIEFFKTQKVFCGTEEPKNYFESSGTAGDIRSRHYYPDLRLYEQSFMKAFSLFFGDIGQYSILALLPSYLEQSNSSLIYMVKRLIEGARHPMGGFYLYDHTELAKKLELLESQKQKTILIGVSYALLDFVEKHRLSLRNTIVVETGGMKGRRREIIREELHALLCAGFGVEKIWSEYGMTELFSQAWSTGSGKFHTPPWLRFLIRDVNDPLTITAGTASGGINVIDLANIHSCAFIATQDLGRTFDDGAIEMLGRFDNAEVRGCNLLVTN